MSGLFGLGRNKNKAENEVESATGTGGYGGSSRGAGNTASEEARNLNYEGSTASGARSGATGATSQLDSRSGAGTTGTGAGSTGTGTGTGSGVRSGITTGSTTTGSTGGVSEGFRGLNLTSSSGFDANHPIVGKTGIVCDTKYYTAVEDRPVIKEIKTYIREHHPIEKEFVVETRPTGQEREQTQGRTTEVVDTKSRIVETTPADPCGGVPTAEYSTTTGATAGRGTMGAGYGSTTTGATTGHGTTGAGFGSSSTGSGSGKGAKTIT